MKADSDSLDVNDRELAADFKPDKLLNQFTARTAARHFAQTFPLLQRFCRQSHEPFRFLHKSIVETCEYLGIATNILIYVLGRYRPRSEESGQGARPVPQLGANTYINAIGGMELYEKEAFGKRASS